MQSKIKTKGIFTFTFRNAKGEVIRRFSFRNKVVDSGLGILASALTIDYIAVGSGTTAPTAGDTTLETEIDRKSISSSSSSGTKKFVSAYFGLTDAVGTINEVGSFSGGSLTADSGTLFSRVSIESNELPVTKTNSESLTIDYEIEIVAV